MPELREMRTTVVIEITEHTADSYAAITERALARITPYLDTQTVIRSVLVERTR